MPPHVDPLGRWTATMLTIKTVKVLLVTLYWIPNPTNPGPFTSISQYNVKTTKVQTLVHYSAQILEEISEYIESRDDVDDIIVARDFYQPLSYPDIRNFFIQNGLFDVFSELYNIPLVERNKTYKYGLFCIDSLAASFNILPYIKYVHLLDYSTIFDTDHTVFFWQLDTDEYFGIGMHTPPKPHHLTLNPDRFSHSDKFVSTAEVILDILNLEEYLQILKSEFVPELIKYIDSELTTVLNSATRAAEGTIRNVAFSLEKVRVFCSSLYWKKVFKADTGSNIDPSALQHNAEEGNIPILRTPISLAQRKEQNIIEYKIAMMAVSTFLESYKYSRQAYLLDFYGSSNDVNKLKQKQRKMIAAKMAKVEKRRSLFSYLSKFCGRGEHILLAKVVQQDENENTLQIAKIKNEIEDMLILYNRHNFQQALSSTFCNDKIFSKLLELEVQAQILSGTLPYSACDDPAVHEFLFLLKADMETLSSDFSPITISEWNNIVRKSKKTSTSSIFSLRTYAIYKCALKSERLTHLILSLLNITIKYSYALTRWKKIFDTVLEKGKEPVLGKLRIIQLIEEDIQLAMRVLVSNRSSVIVEQSPRLSIQTNGNRKGL